jgi:hypothetical protein
VHARRAGHAVGAAAQGQQGQHEARHGAGR